MDTKALRQKILDLAIHGKLVPQDPNDEPASVLLERIKAEKERLIKEGKIKRSKKSAKSSDTPHYPYLLPNGWEWCNLEDIVCELKYGTSEKSLSVGKIAVLRMGNITNVGTIDYSNLVYSSNNEDIKLYSLEKDDLLFNRTNSSEWVGKTAIYKKEQPAIYAGYLIRIRPILIFSDYLNTVMNSSYYRNWCYNVKTDAVNQSNINAQKLSQLMIPIPPLKEQERIVVEVAKWISLIDTIKNSKEDLQTTIKQAKSKILNLAIHGKLVPQDPNDEPAIELLKRINPDFTPCDNGHYSSMIANGYYDYTNTNPRNGYVSGTNHQNPSLIINGGTFAGGLNTIKNDDGAQLVINDGTFTNMSQATVQNHHVAEIKGGTFNTTGSAQYVVDNEGHNGAANDLGQMTISGGTLNGKIYVVGAGASLAVTGGTFSDPSALLYLSGNANVKIRLNGDATCNGFKTQSGQSVELDLNNHVLTLAKPTVGSAGTETNSCQLLKGSTVTMKNGTLASDNDKIMIQNYCNLTLDAMTVKGLNALYVLSNNCGNILISNTTINAGTGAYAFDVCGYSTYTDGVKVTVKGTSIINGNVELSKSTGNTEPMELNIEGGTFNGNLVVDSSITNASSIINVTGTPSFKGTGWDSYKK
jgi:hypothetical protein|nr:restriction endonuclease subunit S [Phocaeicola dorei]